MENIQKHGDLNLVTTQEKRNYLVSEPNYHTTNICLENSLTIKIKKNMDTHQ